MSLFDKVPENFFNIFISSNRDILIDALLVLHKEFKDSSNPFGKDQIVTVLESHLDKRVFEYKEDGETLKNKTLREYSTAIYRVLLKFGWIEEQHDIENFLVYISMPPYASALLDTINNIINPRFDQTEGCVTNIYLNLKAINDESAKYMFLENAYQNTVTLNRLLADMLHNIKIFFDVLLDQSKLGFIFNHFNDYINEISNKRYHPFKTNDNVYKFRMEIVKMTNELIYNDNTQYTIATQMKLKNNITMEEANDRVLGYLDDIHTTFSNLDGKLDQIDKRYSQYLRTTEARIRYISNRDKDFVGNLTNVLKLASEKNSIIPVLFKETARFNNFRSLNMQSLYTVRKVKEKFNPMQTKVTKPTADGRKGMEKMLDMKWVDRMAYSQPQIKQYLQLLFGESDTLHSRDVFISDDIEFVKFILAISLVVKLRSGYKLTVLNEDDVHTNGYILPAMIVKRR